MVYDWSCVGVSGVECIPVRSFVIIFLFFVWIIFTIFFFRVMFKSRVVGFG